MSSLHTLFARILAAGCLLMVLGGNTCTTGPMTATMDVQPDADTVQICVINNVANHTLRVTVRCMFFDTITNTMLGSTNVLNDAATLVVPSGETRYVVCQFRKASALTNIALRLTIIDFEEARITFDPNPSVFEDLRKSTSDVRETLEGFLNNPVMPGQQLQLTYAGMPGAVTQTFSVGQQGTLPANQVIVPQ